MRSGTNGFHVNDDGFTLACNDRTGRCPHKSDAHHATEESARQWAEARNQSRHEDSYLKGVRRGDRNVETIPGQTSLIDDNMTVVEFDPFGDLDPDDPNSVDTFIKKNAKDSPHRITELVNWREWKTKQLKDMLASAPDSPAMTRALLVTQQPGMTNKLRLEVLKAHQKTSVLDEDTVKDMGDKVNNVLKGVTLDELKTVSRSTTSASATKQIAGSLSSLKREADFFDLAEYEIVTLNLYKNPTSPSQVRELMVDMDETTASYDKVIKAERKYGDLKGYLLESKTSGSKQSYTFNAKAIEKMGLVVEDLRVLVGYKWGNHLFGTTYDSKTGRYVGYND